MNNKRLVTGITSGILIFIYGLICLIGGLLAIKGNNIMVTVFGYWYEGLFLLLTGIFLVGSLIYKSYLSTSLAMFFAGIYVFLTVSSRLGGGIQYANNFGFILVFMGIGGFITFLGVKPKNSYYLIHGTTMFFSGITFIVAITTKIYWIIAVGLVMTAGISIIASAVARNRYAAVSTGADNEREGYIKNPERSYNNPYKKAVKKITDILSINKEEDNKDEND